jgi:hypothetical protein
MEGCYLRRDCCFFKDIDQRQGRLWKDLVESYCEGPLASRCERGRFFRETNTWAPLHLMPSGEMPEIFLNIK